MLKFKTKKVEKGFLSLPRGFQKIILEISTWFFNEYEKPLILSETLTTEEEDKLLNRVSTSHREGRAVDIATRNWPNDAFQAFEDKFSYLDAFGAVSLSSNHRRFIVGIPHGSGPHYHLQVGRDMVQALNDQA
jgi:hypothetical protein